MFPFEGFVGFSAVSLVPQRLINVHQDEPNVVVMSVEASIRISEAMP